MYQSITIAGRLGRDPEMKFTAKGTAMTKFSVAVNNYKKETAWFNVTVFGNQAESCNQYLNKGSSVLVTGELQFDPDTGAPKVWQSKDGSSKSSFQVNARDVVFIGGRQETSEQEISEEEVPW